MTNADDKRASQREADTSKGPMSGQSKTAPKVDPKDGAEIDRLIQDHQLETGPKD